MYLFADEGFNGPSQSDIKKAVELSLSGLKLKEHVND
jgi:hypothetical protein